MKYFAKLVYGGQYKTLTHTFDRGLEVQVDKKLHDYLATCVDTKLVTFGNGYKVENIPRFALRTEDLTVEEKVDQEIEDAPDSVALKKPIRK